MSDIAPSSRFKPGSLIPLWLRDHWGRIGIVSIAYLAIFLAWTYFHWGGEEYVSLIGNVAFLFPITLAVITAFRTATHRNLSSRIRQAWLLMGISFVLLFLGEASWMYMENVLEVEPFPSIADIFFPAFYPFMLCGLLTLPSAPQSRRERLIFWLDLLTILTTAAMFVSYFLIVPTAAVNSSDLVSQLLATAYPVLSLILLGGVLALLYRSPEPNTQSTLLLLLLSVCFFLASDLSFGYASLAGTYIVGSWIDTGWNIAQVLAVLAALRQVSTESGHRQGVQWSWVKDKLVRILPLLAILAGYALVLYVVKANEIRAAEWLMAGALLLTLLIIVRQIVSSTFVDLPIRVKVILTFMLVSVLSVILVFAAIYLTIHSKLESIVGERLKSDVEIRSQTLGNEISHQVDVLQGFVLGETIENGVTDANASYTGERDTIYKDLQQRDLEWADGVDTDPLVQKVLSNSMARELSEFRRSFPVYSDLLLTDKYGATLAATAQPGHYSQNDQDWWQAAYNDGLGAVHIGQPMFDPNSQGFSIIIAVPVHEDHGQDVTGVIRATYRIQNILDVLTLFEQDTRNGFDLLLPGGKLLDQQGNLNTLTPEAIADLQSSQSVSYAELNFEGTSQLVSQAPVTSSSAQDARLFKKLNWVLIAHEDVAVAFEPLQSAGKTAVISTFLGLLLTCGVAVILAQVLIAPITRLTDAAGQIAGGNLTTKAQVESKDEIGILANTFNSMLDALALTREELQESEAHYRHLVDYSPDMIAVHCNGKYVFVNPAGVKLLGAKSTDELIGKNVFDMLPEDAREFARRNIEDLGRSGEPTHLLRRKMYHMDGTSFDAEFRAIPITYAGQPAIQLVARDVTERKQAEEKIHQLLAQVARQKGDLEVRVAERTEELNELNQRLERELLERQHLMVSLQDSEERFRLLFEASPDAIFLIDPHSMDTLWPIVDCNQAAARMNGYTREELIGQSIDILNQKKGDREAFCIVLENLRREVVVRGVEVGHRHKAGHLFPIEYSTTLLKVGDRELVLGIDRDITERKNAEEALKQAKASAETSRRVAESASRAKSEFLSRMSHELRTPMNAILGFAQLLEMSRKEPLTLAQKERVTQIVKGGQHLLNLINEILDISRIEANRLHISPEPVAIRETTQEVLDLTVPLAVKRHIQIVTKFGRMNDNPFVMADRQRFKQVLLNLLSNAVKYNFEGGSVIVTCKAVPSNRWRISVADSGPGISPENQTRLFVPFERLNDDQPNIEGTGLGLVLAKRLVELMDGQIGVESLPGKGSTFWIELPATENPAAHLEPSKVTGGLSVMANSTRTILYIEDNVANFELIRQVFADYSMFEMLWAAEAETGIELAHTRRPDLILLDLHLGNSDGADVLQQLKQDEMTNSIPVVVVSADATSGQSRRLVGLGAQAYLTKPLDVKYFVRLIEELLGEKEAEGAN